jgi:sec-independent protein translocase protein TatC
MHRQHNEDLFEHTKMTFGEHLDELRRALVKAVLSLAIGVSIGLAFGGYLIDHVQTPLKEALKDYYKRVERAKYLKILKDDRARGFAVPEDLEGAADLLAEQGLVTEEHLVDKYALAEILAKVAPDAVNKSAIARPSDDDSVKLENLVPFRIYHSIEDDPRVRVVGLAMEEPFVIWMKAAFVIGAVISSPFVFYFIWQFVAAGLYPHEQKYVRVFLPFSIILFLAGAALAYFVVFKYVLAFLFTFFDWMGIDPDPRITDWLSFVLILPLGFGISFQLPLVMLFLERIGILSVATYLSNWKFSVLAILFIAMVLTPSDPYSMMLMAGPLVGLYFFGIMLCKWMPRRTSPFGEVLD